MSSLATVPGATRWKKAMRKMKDGTPHISHGRMQSLTLSSPLFAGQAAAFSLGPGRETSTPRPEGRADRSVTTTPAFGRTRCPQRKGSARTDAHQWPKAVLGG